MKGYVGKTEGESLPLYCGDKVGGDARVCRPLLFFLAPTAPGSFKAQSFLPHWSGCPLACSF